MNDPKPNTDTPTTKGAGALALASAEEMPHPPEGRRKGRKERKGRKGRKGRRKRTTGGEDNASSDEKIMPGAVVPMNRTPRHKTAKQQTDIPTPRDAPSSALGRGKKIRLC